LKAGVEEEDGRRRKRKTRLSKFNVIIHIEKEHPYIEHPPVLTSFQHCGFLIYSKRYD